MEDIQDLFDQFNKRILYSSGKLNHKINNTVDNKEHVDEYFINASMVYERIKEIKPSRLEWEILDELKTAIIDYEDCIKKIINLYTGPLSNIRRKMTDLDYTYDEFKILIDNHQDLQSKEKELSLILHCQD